MRLSSDLLHDNDRQITFIIEQFLKNPEMRWQILWSGDEAYTIEKDREHFVIHLLCHDNSTVLKRASSEENISKSPEVSLAHYCKIVLDIEKEKARKREIFDQVEKILPNDFSVDREGVIEDLVTFYRIPCKFRISKGDDVLAKF